MPQPRRESRAERREGEPIARFHAVRFAVIADAVDYCQRLVPHVVSRFEHEPASSRAVVWFHVPLSDGVMSGGCHLFMSEAAVEAARCAGLCCRAYRVIDREELPPTAVLIFGDDTLDPPAPAPIPVSRVRGSRIIALAADIPDPDAVLR